MDRRSVCMDDGPVNHIPGVGCCCGSLYDCKEWKYTRGGGAVVAPCMIVKSGNGIFSNMGMETHKSFGMGEPWTRELFPASRQRLIKF